MLFYLSLRGSLVKHKGLPFKCSFDIYHPKLEHLKNNTLQRLFKKVSKIYIKYSQRVSKLKTLCMLTPTYPLHPLSLKTLPAYLSTTRSLLSQHQDSLAYLNKSSQQLLMNLEVLEASLADFAKRLLIFQHKTSDYLQLLLKHESKQTLQAIQAKYEKMDPLDSKVLFSIINGPRESDQHLNYSDSSAGGDGKTEDQMEEKYTTFQFKEEDHQGRSENEKYAQTQQRLQPSNTVENNFNIFTERDQPDVKAECIEIMDPLFEVSEPEKEVKAFSPEIQPPLRKRGRPRKADQPKPQHFLYQLDTPTRSSSYIELDDKYNLETSKSRVRVDLSTDLIQKQKKILSQLSQKQKQANKILIRSEFTVVAQFVHNYLVSRLRYSQDHKNHSIPKKAVLEYYYSWCNSNKRKISLNKPSIIQMAITNELKIAFPGVDVYSKYYRGVFFSREMNLSDMNMSAGQKSEFKPESNRKLMFQ